MASKRHAAQLEAAVQAAFDDPSSTDNPFLPVFTRVNARMVAILLTAPDPDATQRQLQALRDTVRHLVPPLPGAPSAIAREGPVTRHDTPSGAPFWTQVVHVQNVREVDGSEPQGAVVRAAPGADVSRSEAMRLVCAAYALAVARAMGLDAQYV